MAMVILSEKMGRRGVCKSWHDISWTHAWPPIHWTLYNSPPLFLHCCLLLLHQATDQEQGAIHLNKGCKLAHRADVLFNSWTCRLAALEKQGLPLGKPRDLLLRQHMSSLGVGICLNKELSWPHPKQEGVFLPLSSFLICKCNVWKNKEIITALKMLFLLWVAGGSLGSKERIHLSWKSGRRRRSRRYEPQIIFSKV